MDHDGDERVGSGSGLALDRRCSRLGLGLGHQTDLRRLFFGRGQPGDDRSDSGGHLGVVVDQVRLFLRDDADATNQRRLGRGLGFRDGGVTPVPHFATLYQTDSIFSKLLRILDAHLNRHENLRGDLSHFEVALLSDALEVVQQTEMVLADARKFVQCSLGFQFI